jgi:malonate-semialdehyde dehydrogenase (acetylating)/methylmalonate-semialdehyde dehydrogenase
MALSTVVAVGNETGDRFVDAMTKELDKLKVGISTDPKADYGPVVSSVHKEKIENYIQMGVDEGADLIVDGRNFSLQGYEKGFFVGPTLFDNVKPTMQSYKDEIFGPVLQVLREDNFESALQRPSEHQYGNGVAIFTRSGGAARDFAQRVNVGMVGINVPIPVPVAYHSFGGWKRSAFGDANQHGMEGVRFYTQTKTVTQRWPDGETQNAAFSIPVME